jgi:hypothetical protein
MRLDHIDEYASLKASLSILALLIAPIVWVLIGLLTALLGPAHGTLESVHKIFEVSKESSDLLQGLRSGGFFEELKSAYGAAFYFALTVLLLFLGVSVFSVVSRLLTNGLASCAEAFAAAFWAIPYWTYRIVATAMLIVVNLAIAGGAFLAVIRTFGAESFIPAILDSLLATGLAVAICGTVNVTFVATLSPLYLCLRYVVPLGFLCARPGGIAARRLQSAYTGSNHFPFWMPT